MVANKSDLPAAWQVDDACLGIEGVVTVSAERGDGMDELVGTIGERLVPNPPLPREAVPFRPRSVGSAAEGPDDLLAGRTAAAAERLKTMIDVGQRAIEQA